MCCIVLFITSSLAAQTGWNESGKRVANNIKVITIENCRQEFGKPDSCSVQEINTYDRNGRLIECASAPNEVYGSQNTYTYNRNGQLIRYQQIHRSDTVTTANEYDANGHRVKSVSMKNGKTTSVTTMKYDGIKLISSVTKNEQGEIVVDSKYTYDQLGKLRTLEWTNKDSDYKCITHYNEKKNRLVDSVMNYSGELTAVYIYEYENDTISSQRKYNLTGFVSETRYTYDSLQRLIHSEVIDSINPYNSRATKFIYDVSGNLIETIEYGSTFYYSRKYTYDQNGKLILETSGTRPESIVTSYTYSDKGELLTIIGVQSSLDTIMNEYDKSGLKIRMKFIQGNLANWTDYAYDNNGYIVNEKKYLQIASDSAVFYYEIEYHNDNEGKHVEAIYKDYSLRNINAQLTHKVNSLPPATFTMVYSYDERDSLLSFAGSTTDKDQRIGEQTIKYTYGRNGKVQEVKYYYAGTDQLRNRIVHEYDDSGRVVITRYFFSKDSIPYRTYRYYYDSHNRLSHKCQYSVWGELIEHTINIYDDKGRLIKVIDGGKGESYRKYSYETY